MVTRFVLCVFFQYTKIPYFCLSLSCKNLQNSESNSHYCVVCDSGYARLALHIVLSNCIVGYFESKICVTKDTLYPLSATIFSKIYVESLP